MTASDCKVSVIVPIYNVENYLQHCIESIINQTYSFLEIILVDDGSTDGSSMICKQLAQLDNRIVVIHQNNRGLSAARNTGMAKATGDFVVFWDSDDWFESTLVEKAIRTQRETNADIVVWNYSADFVDEMGNIQYSSIPQLKTCTYVKGTKFPHINSSSMLGSIGYAWNKLYRRTILHENNLIFEEGTSLVEDLLFNAEAFQLAEIIAFSSFVGTHYMQRDRTTLGTKYYADYLNLKLRARQAQENILRLCQANETDVINFCCISDLNLFWNAVKNIRKSGHSLIEQRKLIKRLYKNTDILKNIQLLRCAGVKEYIKKVIILLANIRLLMLITNKL